MRTRSMTPLDTEAPWYFWWVQGLLKLGDPTLMGVILPGLLVGIMMAIPYIDRNPKRLARQRPIAIAWGLFWVLALGVMSYMGTPEYGIETPAAARIIQELAPEEGIGPLRAIPYEELEPGVYEVNVTDPKDLSGELGEVFALYTEFVNEKAEDSSDFNDPEAVLLITDWATDLKKATLRIFWTEEGERKNLEHEYFIHQDRRRAP